MKSVLLVAAQGLAGVMLACIPFVPSFIKENRLTLQGKGTVLLSATLLLGSMTWSQLVNEQEKVRSDERLFIEISRCVMMLAGRPSEGSSALVVSGAIETLEPDEGSLVGPRQMVRGKAPQGANAVWVVIHPLDTSSYWVQPKISFQSLAEWNVLGYFGRSGSVDSGKSFEIVAIADPEEEVTEGRVFDRWPRARMSSHPRIVVRQ